MKKRGRPRKDQAQKNTSVEALLSPPPGFAPSAISPSHPRYQTRKYLRAFLDRCESIPVTPISPIRHVKSLYHSCATCDFPAHLTTGISIATKEKVDDFMRTELNHHSTLTNRGVVLGVEKQKSGQNAQITLSLPEVVVENNVTVSMSDVELNVNATETETRCDQSGKLPKKGKVVDSAYAGLKHQSVITNHGVCLGVENQKSGQRAQTTPFSPEVVVAKNATISKTDVVLNANATEPETRCDQSGALPTIGTVVESAHAGLKHQFVLTNRGVLGVENQKNATLRKADVTEPETRSDQSGALITKSISLNLTSIAALMTDYSSDADEVESRPCHLSVMVDGYRVKEEAAPVLEKIFLKYGDIATNSSVSSMTFSSSFLEFVCDIYKKLEETDFLSITLKEIQSMLAEVRDLEAAKIDVGWLSRRLSDISQAKQLLQDSCKLKEAKTKNLVVMETNKKELKELKEELVALQERIREKEDELSIAHCENEKIMQRFADSKAKMNNFLKKSLVHDLL